MYMPEGVPLDQLCIHGSESSYYGFLCLGKKMSSTTSLVCFVRGEAEKDIFPVEIDNNLTVENLGDEIRKVRRKDLLHKNFDLYIRKFKQANHALVSR
jgi:hypothetical protein